MTRYNFLKFVAFCFALLSPTASLAESFSVAELRKLAPQKGEFQIRGYIAKQYTCPPCAPEAFCKPCMRDNVLVSDTDEVVLNYSEGGRFLVVFTTDPKKLLLGKFYLMTVKVLESETTGRGIRDLEMISAVEQLRGAHESPAGSRSSH